MTAADPLAAPRADAPPAEVERFAEARTRLATSPVTLPRVRMDRLLGICAVLLAVETAAVLIATDRSWHDALLAGCLVLMAAFGLVFCLAAVTVAGFAAGAAAAGLVTVHHTSLLPVLGGAILLALACGFAPGWARVEAWQAAHARALTSEEEAALAQRSLTGSRSRGWAPGVRLRNYWRSDRVVAAFLVLAFHPCMAAFSLWFIDWTARR